MFRVFKTSAGDFRWVGVSSSAFEDRSGETVPEEAVDYSIKAAEGDFGELRIYHLPGTRVGTCDNSMRVGMFLIESGTFDNTDMAEKVRATVDTDPEKYGLSIGFRYRPKDLVDDRYKKIRIFERSIVEEPDAAALFTNIRLMSSDTEVISMEKQVELVAKLAAVLEGDEEMAQRLYDEAQKIKVKMQSDEKLGFKAEEDTEDAGETTDPVTEPVAEPVAEPVEKPVEESEPVPEAAGPAEDATSVKDFVLELDLPTIQTLAQEVAQRIPAPNQSIAEDVQEQVKTLTAQLDSVGKILNQLLKTDEEKLADMQKQLPRMRLAYRPSSEPETITDSPKETVAEKQQSQEEPKNVLNQSLANSIAAIQEHRNNLRIVGKE